MLSLSSRFSFLSEGLGVPGCGMCGTTVYCSASAGRTLLVRGVAAGMGADTRCHCLGCQAWWGERGSLPRAFSDGGSGRM